MSGHARDFLFVKREGGRDDRLDYLFVCPSLLEPGTKRGGGIEEVDFQVATHLPETRKIAILGPFHGSYNRRVRVGPNVRIELVPFPAPKNYPPSSTAEVLWATLVGLPIYCIPLVLKLLPLLMARPTYVVVHNGLPGVVAAVLCWITHARILYSEGNTYPWIDPFPSTFRPTIPQRGMRVLKIVTGRIIARLAWRVRAQSHSIKLGLISNGVSGLKIGVIPGGVDLLAYSTAKRVTTSNDNRVGFVGRLDEAKGAPLLLDVVKLAGKSIPQVRFVILGDGAFRPHLSKESNVEHVGWVDRDGLRGRLSGVSMVLSFQKEFGLGELEAMAAAKAIIASNRGEVPKIIHHLDNGFLCDPTPGSYVSAITELAHNPELLTKLSERARQTVSERFTWERIAEEWLRMTTGERP